MATTLFIISALCFFISHLIYIFISNYHKDVLSPHFLTISSYLFVRSMMNENLFLEKITPTLNILSIFILMPTAISLAFYINWFLALLIVILLILIVQGLLMSIIKTIIVFFAKGNFFPSIIITFIVGIIFMVIGILVK